VFSASTLFAQTRLSSATLFMDHTGPYTVIDKSNWSRYDNGKYIGHVYREVRASIVPEPRGAQGNLLYHGNFFVLEETLRDMVQSARQVDAIVPVNFEMFRDGNIKIEDDYGFPTLRGFPSYPVGAVSPGMKWTAPGMKAVDPLNTGHPLIIPILAEYEYKGIETYKEIPVHRIFSRYATRAASRFRGSEDIANISGSHQVDILVQVSDGLPLMMRDTMDETYTFRDGNTVRFRGFTLSFGESSVPFNRDALITSIGNDLGIREDNDRQDDFQNDDDHDSFDDGNIFAQNNNDRNDDQQSDDDDRRNDWQNDFDFGNGNFPPALAETIAESNEINPDQHIEMTNVPEGIKLTINDLRFIADQDELLPEENPRLEIIAEILKTIPDRFLLIEGHTAAIGNPNGEMELSIERAKKITDELSARGIEPDRFIYKGWGGTKPVGDNATDAGRRLNRRVEITIME
jgi:outer membrane protein OmpA-like peptidoglycan-associated protein